MQCETPGFRLKQFRFSSNTFTYLIAMGFLRWKQWFPWKQSQSISMHSQFNHRTFYIMCAHFTFHCIFCEINVIWSLHKKMYRKCCTLTSDPCSVSLARYTFFEKFSSNPWMWATVISELMFVVTPHLLDVQLSTWNFRSQ